MSTVLAFRPVTANATTAGKESCAMNPFVLVAALYEDCVLLLEAAVVSPVGPERIARSQFAPAIAAIMVFANSLDLANVWGHGKVMTATLRFASTNALTTVSAL